VRRVWGDESAGAPILFLLWLCNAIGELRATGSPYHLAWGLLDLADYLSSVGETPAGAVAEAREIATRLGLRPILDLVSQREAGAAITA
jgi:hypothetical protein